MDKLKVLEVGKWQSKTKDTSSLSLGQGTALLGSVLAMRTPGLSRSVLQ